MEKIGNGQKVQEQFMQCFNYEVNQVIHKLDKLTIKFNQTKEFNEQDRIESMDASLRDQQDIRYCGFCGWWNHTMRNCKIYLTRDQKRIGKHDRLNAQLYCVRCGKFKDHFLLNCKEILNHHQQVIMGKPQNFTWNVIALPDAQRIQLHDKSLKEASTQT